MASPLVFYTNPMSRGRVVRWMLEEVGQPYQTEILDYGTTMKAPAYLAINPMGKVPALKHGDEIVTECAAICAYLADAFPAAGLAPPVNSPHRAGYYRWLFFGAGPIEAAAGNKGLGVTVPEDKKMMVGYGSMEDVVAVLDAELSRRAYLAGEGFTAADLYVGAQLGWLTRFGVIEKRPSFEGYIARLEQRPAFQRAKAIDDKLMPAPPGAA